MSTTDAALDRQEQIWAGLYGPARAKALIAEARVKLDADPDAEVAAVLAAVGPDDDIDAEEAGTMRPI